MRAVDASWRAVVSRLSPELASTASALTHRLGIARVEGGSWHEYTKLEPMYDLPVFVDDSPDHVTSYRAAHHRAGFFGLLMDRLEDGQAESPDALRPLLAPLREAWIDALAEAMGDAPAARASVQRALDRWRAGLSMERDALSAPTLAPSAYARYVHEKCAWLELTAGACADARCEPARARRFSRAASLMMLAVQLIDDTVDAEEDLRARGVSVPSRLGLQRDALLCAAVVILRRASREAGDGGFERFSAWLSEHARAVDGCVQGDRLLHGLAAVALAPLLIQTVAP